MSDAEIWCKEQGEKLKTNGRQCEALDQIKHHFNTIPSFEVSQKAKLLELPKIFDCLNSTDTKQINTACEVLEICFSNLSIGYVASTAKDNILKALVHESVNVRILGITEIHRTAMNNGNLIPLPEHMDIALAVVKCITDDELKVSVKAMDILIREDWLQYPQIVEVFNSVIEGNSSTRFKCYEVIINIAKKSPEHLEACSKEEFLVKLISELKTKDILLQLNVLELLTNLAVTPHGLKYLVENGVLKSLGELVNNLDDTANLLIPGLMKFFGNIAHEYPTEIFNNFPSIADALFDAIKSNNQAILPVALDTLGFVGSTLEGKMALGALGHVFTSSLSDIGGYIKNAPTEIRVRSLHCAANMISIKGKNAVAIPDMVDRRIILMTREWFRNLSERPSSIEIVFGICKNPFPEIKLSALVLLSAVTEHPWGEELVKDTPGFIEFLLDRSVDHDKESKHAKYEIIVQLSKSVIFDVNVILKLKTYAEEGAFYIQGITEVAIEGD